MLSANKKVLNIDHTKMDTLVKITVVLFCLKALSNCQRLDGEIYPNNGICGTRDVRNSPTYLESLRNCTVIVGSLQILLIDAATKELYANYTFPELREVTHYVLVLRVSGLLSLGHLFPNLALIRGQQLFMNYALVIYESPHLQEIGLKSLTTILRGNVRIEKNPQLCYTDTINWEKISGLKNGHVVNSNGPFVCPGFETCRGCDDKLCWSSKFCQRFPSPECHPECMGGCTPLGGLCYRCKHFIDNDTCVESCPKNKFLHQGAHHCVTKETCRKLYGGRGWTWDRYCIHRCLTGYVQVERNKTKDCKRCEICDVTCDGAEIHSVADIQVFKHCKYVNGSLHIKMMGQHNEAIMKEMEDGLGGIQAIYGYLKVYRSLALTSLNFFKNLTVIYGNELDRSRYAFLVTENNNLQQLWDWSTKKEITIKNGTLYFHSNSQLCMRDIVHLKNLTKSITDDYDVSPDSNGYKARCHLVTLEIESNVTGLTNATITWQRFFPNITSHNILGYLVFYIENPDDDVRTDFERDACYESSWKSVYIPQPTEFTTERLSYNLTNLKPSTRYAYYVETYNNAKESYVGDSISRNGQSIVKFFTTFMDLPKRSINFQTTSYSDDTITIYWKRNPVYRGNITRHIVELSIQPDDKHFLDDRNYCVSPLEPFNYTKTLNFTEDIYVRDDGCTCIRMDRQLSDFIENQTASVEFFADSVPAMNCKKMGTGPKMVADILNEIRCFPYGYTIDEEDIDEANKTRTRRNPTDFQMADEFEHQQTKVRSMLPNVTFDDKYHYFSSSQDFTNHNNYTNFTFFNLKHFTKYMIMLTACKGPKSTDCGSVALAFQRSMKNDSVDLVQEFSVVVISNSAVDVYWEEPVNPNGAILSYTLQFKRTDLLFYETHYECVTRAQHEENNYKHTIRRLNPGKYSMRIRATSLAGDGNYTQTYLFTLPEKYYGFNWLLFSGVVLTIGIAGGITFNYLYKRRMKCNTEDNSLITHVEYTGVRFNPETDEGSVEVLEEIPS